MTAALPPLTSKVIYDAIDSVCLPAPSHPRGWTLRRAKDADFGATTSSSLLFGILVSRADGRNLGNILTTFYLAFSTWDGRVLYIDKRGFEEPNESSIFIYRILALIAVELQCNRYCAKMKSVTSTNLWAQQYMDVQLMQSSCLFI